MVWGGLVLHSSALHYLHSVKVDFDGLGLYSVDYCGQYQRLFPHCIATMPYAVTKCLPLKDMVFDALQDADGDVVLTDRHSEEFAFHLAEFDLVLLCLSEFTLNSFLVLAVVEFLQPMVVGGFDL